MRKLLLTVALVGAALVSMPSKAATIYSNLGPGGSYGCCGGYTVSGSTGIFALTRHQAVEFRSPIYASVDQIDLALQTIAGTDTAEVGLWTKSGLLPGVQLASWTVSGFVPYGSSSSALITIGGISGLELAGGAHHFLTVSPVSNSDDSANLWNQNTTGDVGKFAFNNGAGWYAYAGYTAPLPAFDIIGTQVPEPGTIALVLGGLAGAGRLRRRA